MNKEEEHKYQALRLAEAYNIKYRKSFWWTKVDDKIKLTVYDPYEKGE